MNDQLLLEYEIASQVCVPFSCYLFLNFLLELLIIMLFLLKFLDTSCVISQLKFLALNS